MGLETDEVVGNYKELSRVLWEAFDQAAWGKGRERHANDEPFEDQLMMTITRLVDSFPLGQAIKKIVESQRLDYPYNKLELIGAINYIAGGILNCENEADKLTPDVCKCKQNDKHIYTHVHEMKGPIRP